MNYMKDIIFFLRCRDISHFSWRFKQRFLLGLLITQNKMLRVLENVQLKDGIHTKTLLENQKMLSVNQLAGNIKLTELWKATHVETYPLKVTYHTTAPQGRVTPADTAGKLIECSGSMLSINSCAGDGTRLWNKAPINVKTANSISSAKKEIKLFAAALPI